MLYVYELTTGRDAGTTIEIEHPISQSALTEYKYNGRMRKVRRLISGGTNFILKGGGWSNVGYDRGIQSKLSKEDRANLDKPSR